MTDIVKKLREPQVSWHNTIYTDPIREEAADEIEKLRAEVEHLLRCIKAANDITSVSAYEKLRAENEELRSVLRLLYTQRQVQLCSVSGCSNPAIEQGRGPCVCKFHDPGA